VTPGTDYPSYHVLMLAPDCYMIDRRILQEARALTRSGYRVTLLSGFECPREEHYLQDGIAIHRYTYDWDDERLKKLRACLPASPLLQRWLNKTFMWTARRLLSASPFDTFVLSKARQYVADIIHVHDLPCLRYGVQLAAEWGALLVFDAHEIYYEQESLPRRVQRALRREEQRLVRHTRLFITVNQAIADWYHERYAIQPLVLMNCTETPSGVCVSESRALLRHTADLPPQSRVVLYQGWISSERNLATFVQCAEYLPEDAYVILIGYGAYEQALQALLETKAWQHKVRFLGRIEPEQILCFTAGADVGVIPYLPIDLNHTLCSPNKFFEYVQSGVPVIAHDLPFFRHMAQQHGVVAVGDLTTPQKMAQVITAVLKQAERLCAMREACQEATKTLNWEVEARKLLDAYTRLTLMDGSMGSHQVSPKD